MPDPSDNDEKIVDEGSQDEKGTVEELFGDEDDEFEVEILEYVDMVDEGYYTPTNLFLGILLTLVLLVGAGVGVLVYYAIDDRLDKETKPAITPNPTMAPVVSSTETPSGSFICNICATGEVTIPDGVLDIVGQPKCSDLQARGESGRITEGQCGLLQAITTEPCGCNQATSANKTCTVCAQGVVQNATGVIDVSSAGFPGIDFLTCAQLDVFATGGQIPLEFCPLLQNASAQPCACGEAPAAPASCKVCASGQVRNPDGVLNVTAAGFPGIDSVTCGSLLQFEAAGSIPLEFCSALQEASLETCDCGQDFVCSICGPNGNIGNPDGFIDFGGQNVTCAVLSATTGIILESQCSGVQQLAAAPCGCETIESNNTILELLATVAGEAVYEPNTSEFLAARFLIEEDPRFKTTAGRRRMAPLTTLQENPSGGSTSPSDGGTFLNPPDSQTNGTDVPITFSDPVENTFPNLPMDTPDPQANGTDVPITVSDPESGEPDATPFDNSNNVTDPSDEMETTMTSDAISLSDLNEGQILQRYLLILLYFQTTNNRASRWTTACAAVRATQARQNSTTTCSFRGNQEASRWLSEASECDWAGVRCSNATGEVQSLDLSKFGLKGALPTQIFALPSLSTIDFSTNNITGNLAKLLAPSNSSNAGSSEAESSRWSDSLKNLLLGGNSLSGSLPSEIAEFANLQVLQLYRNKLEGSIPSELATLVNLTLLDLSGNSLEGVIPTELGLLTNVRRLLLFNNTLSGDIPSELSNLSRLQILNLAKNNFTTQVVDDLCVLKSTIIGVDCGNVSCECCSCCDDKNCEGDSVVL